MVDVEAPSAPDLAWMAPGSETGAREALGRVEQICAMHPTLFAAMFAVLATHPAVPRPLLAAAIMRFRRDTDAYTPDDVAGMLTAIDNGARQAFDAVVRTRRGSDRKASALPFVRPE